MIRACSTGHLAFAKILRSAGAKIDNRDGNGNTCLHVAVEGLSDGL